MVRKLILGSLALAFLIGGASAFLVFGASSRSFQGTRNVKIPPGASLETVVDSLDASGVLKSRSSFSLVARLTGWGGQIKAGNYEVASSQSNYALLSFLRAGLQTPVRVRIPAGSIPWHIAAAAARNMAFDASDFLHALRDEALAAELGTDTLHLFSYMLPETYFFYWLTDAPTVVRRVKSEVDSLYQQELGDQGQALEEIVSLAAIVEWETSVEHEKARVAGVYRNRLRLNWPLQADPTVQFAVEEREGRKRRLLYADYRIDHPYNTYLYTGLPPGPVTNPSASSLRAAAHAEDHKFMFFVANPDGGHTFNTTLRGHNRDAAAIRRYWRARQQAQASE